MWDWFATEPSNRFPIYSCNWRTTIFPFATAIKSYGAANIWASTFTSSQSCFRWDCRWFWELHWAYIPSLHLLYTQSSSLFSSYLLHRFSTIETFPSHLESKNNQGSTRMCFALLHSWKMDGVNRNSVPVSFRVSIFLHRPLDGKELQLTPQIHELPIKLPHYFCDNR